MKEFNEQTEVSAQNQTAELESTGATETEVSLGKFKDAQALLTAYNALQSEFTKRCQKIKELENKLASASDLDEKTSEKTEQSASVQLGQDTTLKDKNEVLKEYLLDILGKKTSAIVIDDAGVGAKTPKTRPKTVQDAGKLAKEIFTKR